MSKPAVPAKVAPAASVATTSAATLLVLFTAAESRGQIVTNTELSLPSISVNLTAQRYTDWNIDGEGSAEVQFYVSSYNANLYLQNALNSFGFVGAADNNDLRNLALLPSPETVSVSRVFFNAAHIAYGSDFQDAAGFISGQEGYIGFRYKSAVTDTILYGWASVTITPGFSGSFTINEWAYDASGASIQVGQTSAIPEPANVAVGLGALALGAAGLMRWRKRKAA